TNISKYTKPSQPFSGTDTEATLAQVGVLLQSGFWDGVANRLYYAAFHAVCALLIDAEQNIRTHHGINSLFNQLYIKTGKIPREYGQLFSTLQLMRQKSDYNCWYSATEEEILPMVAPTEALIEMIKQCIKQEL
ncbi:MAG: HEPN domain-containing protein, partial [Muribaculaceae bacterium]